jgi:KUP system potassium uptake protein
MMLIWFGMLAILGIAQISQNLEVFKAINPYYAYHLVSIHPDFFCSGV